MVSLATYLAFLLASLVLIGAATALPARALGSANGRLRVGLAVVVIITAVGLGALALISIFPIEDATAATGVRVLVMIVELVLLFDILRRAFKLSAARTFGLLAAYLIASVVVVCLGLWAYRPLVAEAFVIPTASMAPTLEPGDRIMASKFLQPRRWDLVAYRTNMTPPDVYCKRLVGLPGEGLRFEDGLVFVNNQQVAAPLVVAGKYHASIAGISQSSIRYHDGETIQLGPDEYFFVGDNVERSGDSRIMGPTRASQIVGVIDFRYWPLRRLAILR